MKANQGEVLSFKQDGEVFGQWRVTKHPIQHVFAETDPTTGRATLRAMVCYAEEGDPQYDRCRMAPTKEAADKVRRAGRNPTVEEVAPLIGLRSFPPQQWQRAFERQRASADAARTAALSAGSSAPEPAAGAVLARTNSGGAAPPRVVLSFVNDSDLPQVPIQ